jgi:uncharacterized protein YxeA
MKKLLIVLICVIAVTTIYFFSVVKPNISNQQDYKKCIRNSITEEEAARYNYAGNIRNDKANPKTCDSGREVFTEFSGNRFLP